MDSLKDIAIKGNIIFANHKPYFKLKGKALDINGKLLITNIINTNNSFVNMQPRPDASHALILNSIKDIPVTVEVEEFD